MKRIGVTGPHGRLGRVLVSMGCIPIEADILKPDVLRVEMQKASPEIVIHAAAFTNVDAAEDNPEQAMRVNVRGTANVRDAFLGRIIFISTDYVFDGKSGPYRENDIPNPINWYGLSKVSAESMLYSTLGDVIVRTTALYGPGDKPDFVKGTLEKYRSGRMFFVSDKVRGNPTYIPHLAEALIFMAEKMIDGYPACPIINISGKEVMTRFEWAVAIGKEFRQDTGQCQPSLVGLTTDRAKRPKRAGFFLKRAQDLGIPLFSVAQGLKALHEANPDA